MAQGTAPHQDRSRSRGMSLLELLAVLAILAGLASLVVPSLSGGSGGRLELGNLAREVARSAALVRAHAIRTGEIARLEVDLERRTILADVVERQHAVPDTVALSVRSVSDPSTDDGRPAVAFFPNGQSSGGTIRLETNGLVSDVVINWVSGHAAVKGP